jgi:nickel/cobalt transporter (NicO) family protein
VSLAPALLLAAAGVGLGHAVMPDHWAPLAIVGRVNRYSLGRVTRVATLAGAAHVIVSLLLGAIVVLIGLQFRGLIEHAQDTIVGVVLILTGLVFALVETLGGGHHHGPGGHTHDHDGHTHDHDHAHPERRSVWAVLVPFGAAASPDLTILPVFLAAAATGVATAVGTLVVFALATIATIVLLTAGAFLTGYRLDGKWLDRWGNLVTAGVLLCIGGLVLGGVI